MPAGLQCWDSSGNLVVDITSRLAQVSGSAIVDPSKPTSVTLPSGGVPWYAFQPTTIWGYVSMNVMRPNFSVSGQVLSWSWSPPTGTAPHTITGTVFFGIY